MSISIKAAVFGICLIVFAALACVQALGEDTLGIWPLLGIYTALSIATLSFAQARVEHPAVLFTLIFWFYVVAYPIVVSMGMLPDYGITPFVITLHIIGYIAFVLPTLLTGAIKPSRYNYILPKDSLNTLRLGIIILILLGVLQMALSLATNSYKGGGWAYSILATSAPQMYVVVAAAILFSQTLFTKHRMPMWTSLFLVLYTLSPLFITGRRTPGIIAALVILMLLEIRYRRLGIAKLSIIIMAGFVTIGVSKDFGTILVTNQSSVSLLNYDNNTWKEFVGGLFYREFKTSGRITAASIEYGAENGFPSYGKSYLTRLAQSSAPGFLIEGNSNNIIRKLNVFITDGGTDTGLGYSIIAEGYNNFGVIGVFLNLFVLGLVTCIFYRYSDRSPVYHACYIVFLAIICARLRSGTLSIYLMTLYSLILPVLLLCLARLVIYGSGSYRLFLSKKWQLLKPLTSS